MEPDNSIGFPRTSPTENQNIELVAQVESICPLCSKPLLDKRSGQRYKRFEVAHIYPLNPTPEEASLLAAEERLSKDPNDLANLIPLCRSCHGEFDKPRTVEGYRQLIDFKRESLQRERERDLWHRYPLEDEIRKLINALVAHDGGEDDETELDLEPVDTKTEAVPPLMRRKIKAEVRYYFLFVQRSLLLIEQSSPGSSNLLAQQVRAFYLAQSQQIQDKEELYKRVGRWIHRRAGGSKEATEIVTSFFVQNCEVLS